MSVREPLPEPESVLDATGHHWKYQFWVFLAVLLASLVPITQLKLKSLYWLLATLVAAAAVKAFRESVAKRVE